MTGRAAQDGLPALASLIVSDFQDVIERAIRFLYPAAGDLEVSLVLLDADEPPAELDTGDPVVPEPMNGSRTDWPQSGSKSLMSRVGLPVRWCLSVGRTRYRKTPGKHGPSTDREPLDPQAMYSAWFRYRPRCGRYSLGLVPDAQAPPQPAAGLDRIGGRWQLSPVAEHQTEGARLRDPPALRPARERTRRA